MRTIFKNELARYFVYKSKQNQIVKNFYRLFPDKYADNFHYIRSAFLELSSNCNLKCPFCTNRFRTSGNHMTYEKAIEYFNKLPRTIKNLQLHFSGESFLNTDISRITQFLSEKGLFLSVSTNGTLPAQKYIATLKNGLDQLIFAVDGATPETHEKYRVGSHFDKIIETLEDVIKHRPARSRVGVQYLVTRYNEAEVGKMRVLLKRLGADFFNLKTLSLDIAASEKLDEKKLENANNFLPKNQKYSRYRFRRGELKLKYPIIICPFVYQPVVCADGEVCLCCIDLERKTSIGNLDDFRSFEDLWNTDSYRSIRKQVINKDLSICQRCNYCFSGLKSVPLHP